MRAFIAVEVPEATKKAMAELQAQIRSDAVDASWTRPEGIHLTLKFLGETSEERVPEIAQALTRALGDRKRFGLGVEGVGTFPQPASARVDWFGLTGGVDKLLALQAAVEEAMAGIGFVREARPFTPHLTLGRIRRVRRRDVWLKRLEEVKAAAGPGFEVTGVSLMASELKPTGALYRELNRVTLEQEPESAAGDVRP